jgi:Carboxypeptidase regulatory-like domain/TonB dependent receptor/TonB-dependent Receptor Plug Domain
MRSSAFLTTSFLTVLACFGTLFAQSSTGSISGTVFDEREAVIPGATVTIRNTATGFSRSATTNSDGRYRFENVPTGAFEVTIEAQNFSKYVQTGITLDAGQDAVVDTVLKAGNVQEVVTVNENASLLNTSTAEVSTRFDERRLSELPISTNRNVLNVLLSVPGVSQLGSGQAAFATGLSFSANGGRLRSNNFMLDGQDINDATFTGAQVALNNPDAIQEVIVITNQYKAEYGHNSGSVLNVVGKSGTNNYHGSLFWFHNNEYLNACSNLDKVATGAPTGFCTSNAATDDRKRAPRRNENQIGFTFGGPLTLLWFGDGAEARVWKGTDKTFIFGDYQRWSDRALVSGPTLSGAPTAAGRAVLQSVATGRSQVQALLDFVPAGIPNGTSATFTIPGQQPRLVELGDLTGSSLFVFDDHQGSVRIDHRLNEKNLLYGRYRFDSQDSSGAGQVTPPGLTTVNESRSSALAVVLNSALTSKFSNEARLAWSQLSSRGDAEFPLSKTIPSIVIGGLGMILANPQGARTAIGFPFNLPGFREHDTYQITDALSYVTGNHSMKFGVELRRTDARLLAILNTRGSLNYNSLSTFINDVATLASKNYVLSGGDSKGFYRWHEFYTFAQDEWRIRDDLTLTFGVRYEYPGDSFSYLRDLNARILAANGNNPAFRLSASPKTDTNNFMPRIGFNWNPHTSEKGIIGFVTGGNRLVIRGGYARTYDPVFMNLYVNMGISFPFVATPSLATTGAFAAVQNTTMPDLSQANRFTRTVVSEDIRSPATDQISFEIQREITKDIVMKVGYIRTRGTGLLQTVDGNPCRPGLSCANQNFANRVNPSLGIIGLTTNSASSTYDALQAGLTKRLSNNFSAGLHYTWSTLIDDATDVLAASLSESNRSQDSFDRRADRARSGYDRPHRLTGNLVYELPFYRHQRGVAGRLLGGWQVNSFFTFQSGAPFTVTLGSDALGTGNPIRPYLNTNLDLSSMTIRELRAAGGASLFRPLSQGQRVGSAGRNILRADDFGLVDFGIIKNSRVTENVRVQLRADMFNCFNSRNFGIPNGAINSGANFLNQWATNGGNRRIILGARLVF